MLSFDLAALEAQPFDLLLMDLNYTRDTVSEGEGLDLLATVQALDCTLPIVVMTAWSMVELAVEAVQQGVVRQNDHRLKIRSRIAVVWMVGA